MKKTTFILMLLLMVISLIATPSKNGPRVSSKKLNEQTEKITYRPYATAGFVVPIAFILSYDFIKQGYDLGKIKDPTDEIKIEKIRKYAFGALSGAVCIMAFSWAITKEDFPVIFAYEDGTSYLCTQVKF